MIVGFDVSFIYTLVFSATILKLNLNGLDMVFWQNKDSNNHDYHVFHFSFGEVPADNSKYKNIRFSIRPL